MLPDQIYDTIIIFTDFIFTDTVSDQIYISNADRDHVSSQPDVLDNFIIRASIGPGSGRQSFSHTV